MGKTVKGRYGLSWVGRPAIFRDRDSDSHGGYSMLFHGVNKAILPDNDYAHWPVKYQLWQFFRSVYLAKLTVDLDGNGAPRIQLDPDRPIH